MSVGIEVVTDEAEQLQIQMNYDKGQHMDKLNAFAYEYQQQNGKMQQQIFGLPDQSRLRASSQLEASQEDVSQLSQVSRSALQNKDWVNVQLRDPNMPKGDENDQIGSSLLQ